jgi:hypothetical protein
MIVFHPLAALLLQATHDPEPLWVPRTRHDWIKFYAANKYGHCNLEGRTFLSMGCVKDEE